MNITIEKSTNSTLIHEIMIKAFSEYKKDVAPSSALDETVEMISTSLANGEKALIGFIDDKPAAMLRFQIKKNYIYFSRLSVIPEHQGKGIAKSLVKALEKYAKQNKVNEIQCKVRMSVPRNIQLYESIGYEIFEEDIVHKPNGVDLKVVSMRKYMN